MRRIDALLANRSRWTQRGKFGRCLEFYATKGYPGEGPNFEHMNYSIELEIDEEGDYEITSSVPIASPNVSWDERSHIAHGTVDESSHVDGS